MDFIIIKVIMAIVNIQEDSIPSGETQTYFDCGKLSTPRSNCPTGPLQKKVL